MQEPCVNYTSLHGRQPSAILWDILCALSSPYVVRRPYAILNMQAYHAYTVCSWLVNKQYHALWIGGI